MFDVFLSEEKPEQHIFTWSSSTQDEDITLYYSTEDKIVGSAAGEAEGDGLYWFYSFSGKKKEGNTYLVSILHESEDGSKVDPVTEEWTFEGKKMTINKTKRVFEKQ